ncbi:hypothetical protein I7I50_11596 [Histoplasma capsulatum G186AR]|uniref:Uncharacterized protein n=1 Tax=Ajellomyces capsulatus TaxID=5037 RepID=A0A8H8D9E0_AJECA|nr:hypothetical protein I7I52_02833 [Histoplasma capsulatum]QSS70086.1 hypothetical protein I7I50_11596 [Histoplasma capsulatum G186AR]
MCVGISKESYDDGIDVLIDWLSLPGCKSDMFIASTHACNKAQPIEDKRIRREDKLHRETAVCMLHYACCL